MLWEEASTRSKIILTKYSEEYKELKIQKNKIEEQFPELCKIIEGDPINETLILDNVKVQKLSELIGICADISWLYQKMFYVLGISAGEEFAEIMKIIKEKKNVKE